MESFLSPSVSVSSLSNCAGKLLTCGITTIITIINNNNNIKETFKHVWVHGLLHS